MALKSLVLNKTKNLQLFFEHLVELTEPICQALASAKADMTIFDSFSIKAFVTENNPKYANKIILQLKTYAKTHKYNKSYDPYKTAYRVMPSHARVNPELKQLYINSHFCYVFKFGIVTNDLGIISHISFYNKEFLNALHTDLILAGITQLITVALANRIYHLEYIRSLKPIIV